MAFCSAKSRTLQVFSNTTSAGGLGLGERIALGDELGGDGFAVALVHLASRKFLMKTLGIFPESKIRWPRAVEKLNNFDGTQLACGGRGKLVS